MLLDIIIVILLSGYFHFILTCVIYYLTQDKLALTTWFYVYALANAWDIASTYTFVYLYDLGWENEGNNLIQWFAGYVNYHWAVVLQTIVFCGSVIVFCIIWPWPAFAICTLIYVSSVGFIAGTLNLLFPIIERTYKETGKLTLAQKHRQHKNPE